MYLLCVTNVRLLNFSVFLFLKVITLEGWVEIMYYVMDAHSFYNFIYFILLIIVSSCSLRLLTVWCPERSAVEPYNRVLPITQTSK